MRKVSPLRTDTCAVCLQTHQQARVCIYARIHFYKDSGRVHAFWGSVLHYMTHLLKLCFEVMLCFLHRVFLTYPTQADALALNFCRDSRSGTHPRPPSFLPPGLGPLLGAGEVNVARAWFLSRGAEGLVGPHLMGVEASEQERPIF